MLSVRTFEIIDHEMIKLEEKVFQKDNLIAG
jgi:hypothetical protein